MGLRFTRRVSIVPGLRLNLSKRGAHQLAFVLLGRADRIGVNRGGDQPLKPCPGHAAHHRFIGNISGQSTLMSFPLWEATMRKLFLAALAFSISVATIDAAAMGVASLKLINGQAAYAAAHHFHGNDFGPDFERSLLIRAA